ncbi:MAG: bifunctional methylenetetrahydrofolate dehydrogenase/methenyltetrahydrofolate cyclohydrolase FolD [Micavibrio sp.]|nr:bifunctional methylenetetrahydrofolate dehydrogenase/methenyltetrahydrofolate cyclohydrolase FolD [Micavibrio sp.]|tara:strand:+ start:542 stop:1381 length:840 start_codon:yes stop_codon:yes gene_type:complete
MTAQRIDGRKIAAQLRQSIAQEVTKLPSKPGLAVILVGDDPASQIYVAKKIKTTEEVGMVSIEKRLAADASEEDVAATIQTLNNDKSVHGILLQLPLPKHLNSDKLIQMINPAKDVDGLTYHNIARLVTGEDGLVPCTPQGSLKLIQSVKKDLTGLHAVVIGRSLLFGKPMAQLLLQENCTVTTAHSKTKDLKSICQQADILVAAVGRPAMVKGDWIKSGAIIIDVGINRLNDNSICGDVDFEAAKETALAITPVPGGVGPMTIACLLANTLKAYKNSL